ncbi:hypothetical protein L218DRAFT_998257 [Marasmius fiardii PR-910]|nr:hypothetical protein L218DRAFT_998257 [Marasmius fiardii PR-910]
MHRRSAQRQPLDNDSIFCPVTARSHQPRDNASYPYPSRLKSPFQPVSYSNGNAITSYISTSNPAGSKQSRSPHRRQRHCARSDRPAETVERVSHRFDRLPWISIMDIPPSEFPAYDIADLSQLPIQGPSTPTSIQSDPNGGPGCGPVRRRKRSFRADPLCFPVEPSSPTTSLLNHTNQTVLFTPPSKARRPRTFQRLMPVFSCDIHDFDAAKLPVPSHFLP